MKKTVIRIICAAVVLSMVFAFSSCGKNMEIKNEKTYASEVENLDIFENKTSDAFPQTIIHKIIMEHFNSPLPEGKTVKKVIFIGYDGFRADGLENIKDMPDSGIMYLKSQGGLYNTFSGGVKGVNEQATSTAPSWLAMLTGGWADYNGVDDNGMSKNPDADTFLTKIARTGKAVSFTASWREHTKVTYAPDIENSIKEGLLAEYTHEIDDEATYYQILKYVTKTEGEQKTAQQDPDAIFFTLEYTDHAGHDTGFGNKNEEYVKGCKDADSHGYDIIKTIEARSTYAQEDWLILISTDHGGTQTGHGGQTLFEKMTWLSCNKEIPVTKENLEFALTK